MRDGALTARGKVAGSQEMGSREAWSLVVFVALLAASVRASPPVSSVHLVEGDVDGPGVDGSGRVVGEGERYRALRRAGEPGSPPAAGRSATVAAHSPA